MSTFKIIIFLKILIIFGCTNNPFWDDFNRKENQLNGQIITVGSNVNHPVLFWDDYSLRLTETDTLGFFSIDLNNVYNDLQSVSGELKIYFYALNYNLDSASIFLTKGSLSKNQIDFNQDGILTKIIELNKKINVEMKFLSNELNIYDTLQIQYDIEIIEPITIKSYIFNDQHSHYESGLLFLNLGTNEIIKYNHSSISMDGILIEDQLKYTNYNIRGNYQWNYLIPHEKILLEPGTYIIKPYYLIIDNVFNRFYSDMNKGIYSFEYDGSYLNIPSDIKVHNIIIN